MRDFELPRPGREGEQAVIAAYRAADAFVVARGNGRTVIAGYPWFTDWGRDTFIALRGLCLAGGRLADARRILIDIEVDSHIPVTRGTYAQLGMEGITGIAYVHLLDDGKDAQPARGIGGRGVVAMWIGHTTLALGYVAVLVAARLREVFAFLQSNLKDTEVDLRDIEYAACNGMLRTLDPHSILLTPEDYSEMQLSTRGEFGGLGIVISIRDGQLTVLEKAGGTVLANACGALGTGIITLCTGTRDPDDMWRHHPGFDAIIQATRQGWLGDRSAECRGESRQVDHEARDGGAREEISRRQGSRDLLRAGAARGGRSRRQDLQASARRRRDSREG